MQAWAIAAIVILQGKISMSICPKSGKALTSGDRWSLIAAIFADKDVAETFVLGIVETCKVVDEGSRGGSSNGRCSTLRVVVGKTHTRFWTEDNISASTWDGETSCLLRVRVLQRAISIDCRVLEDPDQSDKFYIRSKRWRGSHNWWNWHRRTRGGSGN